MESKKLSVEIIRKGHLIGKLFLCGYVLGTCAECLSSKKTSYGKFLGTKMALFGIPIVLASKVKAIVKRRK